MVFRPRRRPRSRTRKKRVGEVRCQSDRGRARARVRGRYLNETGLTKNRFLTRLAPVFPGYRFKAVDAMITNFHLPKSTLLMLVSAFAGRQHVLNAYQEAINRKYRFYSYGDAMFIY